MTRMMSPDLCLMNKKGILVMSNTNANLNAAMVGKYCIIRGSEFGVFAGTVEAAEGDRVLLKNARRLWYWDGAASLSQLAAEGVKNPSACKFTVTVEYGTPVGIYGDVDGDGVVTVDDATLIQRRGVELEKFTELQDKLADVNGDGRVSILDVTCVQKYLAEWTEGIGNTGKPCYE